MENEEFFSNQIFTTFTKNIFNISMDIFDYIFIKKNVRIFFLFIFMAACNTIKAAKLT